MSAFTRPGEPGQPQHCSRIHPVLARDRVQRHSRRFELSNERAPLGVEPADDRRKTPPIELGDDRDQVARLPAEPRPSTTWRTVSGEPVLIPAEED